MSLQQTLDFSKRAIFTDTFYLAVVISFCSAKSFGKCIMRCFISELFPPAHFTKGFISFFVLCLSLLIIIFNTCKNLQVIKFVTVFIIVYAVLFS